MNALAVEQSSERPKDSGEHHWGARAVDLDEASLPGLKARFLVERSPAAGVVCEIGCGDGKLLRTLARHRPGLVLHGCDVRAPTTPPDGFTFHRIVDALPFADRSLDAVLLFDVLEHVPQPARMLNEAARLLKPEGRLLAFVPIEGERLSFYEAYRLLLGRDLYVKTKEHIQAFTHRALRALFAQRFELVETRYAYHALGQFMDASFFAAARLPFIRDFWWRDNTYYNEAPSNPGAASRSLNALLRLGNAAAWVESSFLSRVPVGAAGMLAEARVRPRS